MKTYLFCVGGTGARVLKALCVYMAADVQINGTIIPIILDMDMRNGDTQRTLQMLDTYRFLQDEAKLSIQGSGSEGYFKNGVGTLSSTTSLKTENLPKIKDNFQLDFEDSNQSFGDYIGYHTLKKVDQDFMRALFDNSDQAEPNTELQLNLIHGFKGNPNIGSVVFNNMVNTPEYTFFEQSFDEGDRVFLVSSIFGGTGASGFPQLVKNIRTSNVIAVRDAKIGALVVMPYFQVKKESESSIDSQSFNSKTKAALHYYATELADKITATYYIADKPGRAMENSEGGTEQKNRAHVLELIGAMGIQHFINSQEVETATSPLYFEYGIKDLPTDNILQSLSFQDFYVDEQPQFAKWATFVLTVKFIREKLEDSSSAVFFKDLELGSKLRSDYFYVRLRKYCDYVWEWLQESNGNERGFTGFNLAGPFNSFITNGEAQLDSYMMGFKNPIEQKINEVHNELTSQQGLSEHQYFLLLLHKSFKQLYTERIQRLPTRS